MELTLGLAVLLSAVGAVFLDKRPVRSAFIGFGLLAILPLPNVMAPGVSLAGAGTVFWADFLAAILLMMSIARSAGCTDRKYVPIVLSLLTVILFFCLLGWLGGASPVGIARDARGALRLVAAFSGTCCLISSHGWSEFFRLLVKLGVVVSIWTAVAVVLVTAMGDFAPFSIRSESAGLYIDGEAAAYNAVRVAPNSGLACAMFASIGTAMFFRRGDRWGGGVRFTTLALACAWFVVFAGFTRGHVLVAAVVLLGFWIFLPGVKRWRIGRLLFLCLPFTAIAAVGVLALNTQASSVAGDAAEAFLGRVIYGLSPDVVSGDSSLAWRAREADAAIAAVFQSPVLGSGFGVPYRSFLAGEIFTGEDGLTYLHNTYLWVLVKGGTALALLLSAYLIGFLGTLIRAKPVLGVRATLLAGTLLIALGGVSVGTPIPFESSNSVLVGILFGAVYSLSLLASRGDWVPSWKLVQDRNGESAAITS